MQTAIGASLALKDVFIETGVKVQTHLFKIDGSIFTTVEGGHSMSLDFSPFSFHHQNGQPAGGVIDLQLELATTKSEILSSGYSCLCEGQLLEMFGQFKISASKGGEQLFLGKSALVRFSIPADFSYNHEIFAFKGERNKTQTRRFGKAFDWVKTSAGKGQIQKRSGNYFFEFPMSEIEWMAVGTMPFHGHKKVMLSVKHQPMACPLIEKAAFLVLDHNKTVIKMFSGNKYFSAFNIPENFAAKLIIITTDGENLYLGSKSVSNICKSVYYVPLEIVSLVSIRHLLRYSLK